jgi:hypothetical protein
VASACSSDEPDQSGAARSPAPRVAATTPEPPRGVQGPAPQPQPPKSGSKSAATSLCKALSEVESVDDPEAYLAGLKDDAATAGLGFARMLARVQRALAADDIEKAGVYYGRLGTLCEDVVGRRNF